MKEPEDHPSQHQGGSHVGQYEMPSDNTPNRCLDISVQETRGSTAVTMIMLIIQQQPEQRWV